jgi:hypothetical protein
VGNWNGAAKFVGVKACISVSWLKHGVGVFCIENNFFQKKRQFLKQLEMSNCLLFLLVFLFFSKM